MRWRRLALNLNGMPQLYRDSGRQATARYTIYALQLHALAYNLANFLRALRQD